MKSGYILAICLFILGSIDFWIEYEFFRHTDNDEYSWIIYCNAILIIPITGLLMHKRWGLGLFRFFIWLWIIAAFWTGLIIANTSGAPDLFAGMIGSLKSHWWQFILFFGLLYFSKTDKVKKDFGIVEKKIE
jgi:hypothetical protein